MFKLDVRCSRLVIVFSALVAFVPLPVAAQTQERALLSPADSPGISPAGSASVPQATSEPAPTAVPVAPPPTLEQLGDSLIMHQRYEAAIEDYAKAPPSAPVWNKMGIAYQMMFDPKDAERCYKESLKLDPNNSSVINNLATVYDSQKLFGSAEKLYRRALKVDPHSALLYKNLGTNQLSQHKYERGWQAYQRALAIDPQTFQDRSSPQVQSTTSIQDRGAMNYYMALGCVQAGHTECALKYLGMALDEGYTNPKKIASDVAFASLRDNPDFKELLAAQQQNAKAQQSR